MGRFNSEQDNFNAGELSPRFYARTTLDKYATGLKQCRNMIPTPQGMVTHRPGFRFVNEVRTSGHIFRLLRFEFNVTQSYVFEFGPFYIRFYTNNARIEGTGASLNQGGLGSPIGLLLSLTYSSNIFSAENLVYEIATDYSEDELFDIVTQQLGDIIFLFHRNHPPQELRRLTANTFQLVAFDYLDGPFESQNTTATTLVTSGFTGTVNITASTAVFTTTAEMKGMLVRIKRVTGGLWGCLKIDSITSTTIAVATYQPTFEHTGATAATVDWRFGAWSPIKGWPGCATFYQQRLLTASTNESPDTIWSSTSENFRLFSPTDNAGAVQDNKGFAYPIGSDAVNAIVSLVAGKIVTVLTHGGEWILVSGSTNNPDPLTPTSVKITQETTYGSTTIQGIRVEAATFFIDKGSRTIREFIYGFNSDSYAATDLNLLCDHLFRNSTIKSIAWAQHPHGILWIALENGDLISMTYLREQQVVGFAKHNLGGRYFNAGTPVGLLLSLTRGTDVKPEVRTIVSVHSPDGTYSQLWAGVRKIINGEIKDYIEIMDPFFEPAVDSDKINAFFVDSGLTLTSEVTVTTISGLSHLEGETVSIVVDGAAHDDRIVINGEIELNSPAKVIHVGQYQEALIETLNPKQGENVPSGTAQSKVKRIHKVGVRFDDTIGAEYGMMSSSQFPLYFRESTDLQNQGPRLFSGVKKTEVDGEYSEEQHLIIKQPQPLPFSITAIYLDGNVNEV